MEITVSSTAKSALSTQRQINKVTLTGVEKEVKVTGVGEVSLPNSLFQQYLLQVVAGTSSTVSLSPYSLWAPFAVDLPHWVTYIRPEFVLTLDIVTNVAVYGILMVNVLPWNSDSGGYEYVNQDPYIIDMNEGGIHEITIPYMDIVNFFRVGTLADRSPKVILDIITYSISSTSTPAKINVYGKMKSLGPRGVSQSGYGGYANLFAGAATLLAGAVNTADTVVKTTKTVRDTQKLAGEAVGEVKSLVGDAVDSVTYSWDQFSSIFTSDETVGETKPQTRMPKGLDVPAKAGIEYVANNVLGDFTNTCNMAENYNTIIYSLQPENKGDMEMRHSLRAIYSRPEIHSFIDMAAEADIVIPVQPVWNYQVVRTSPTVYRLQQGYNTHLNMISQLFAYWRGGMNYKLKFYGSPFVSYQIRTQIRYAPGNITFPASDPPRYYTDTIVNGSTEIDVEVPYLCATDWIDTGTNPFVPKPVVDLTSGLSTGLGSAPLAVLHVTISNIMRSTGDMDPVVFAVVVAAPMDDFQIRHWYPRKFTPLGASAVAVPESQSRILDSKFSATTIVEGQSAYKRYPVEEDAYTFEDLTRRWSVFSYSAGTVFPYHHWFRPDWFTSVDYRQIPNDVYLSQMFWFIRGNFDIKIKASAPDFSSLYMTSQLPVEPDIAVSIDQPFLNNGAVVRDTQYNDVIDGTYIAEGNTEWFWVQGNNDFTFQYFYPVNLFCNAKTSSQTTIYTRGGKNMQVALLAPPYRAQYMPWYIGY